MSEGEPVLPGMGHLRPAGNPAATRTWPLPPEHTVARFCAKVTCTPGCWWWTGALSHPDGCGRISWTQDGQRRTLSAHRFALLIAGLLGGPAAVSEHQCNETVRVRVHPEHLHPGTQSANLRYAVTLGRHRGPRPGVGDPRGRHGRAHAIRAVLRDGYDPLVLAAVREYGTTPTLPLFALDDFSGTGVGHVSER